MPTVVKVRGTDVTAHTILAGDHKLTWGPLDVGQRVSTAKFRLKDSTPVVPEDDDVVEITDTDGVTVRFGGKVRQARQIHDLEIGLHYAVLALSWEAVLDRIKLKQAYTWAAGTPDSKMVTDLATDHWSQVATGVTHVIYSARPDMPALTLEAGRLSLLQAFEQIAAIAGGVVFWVHPSLKRLHWNDVRVLAPFALGDKPNGTTIRAFTRSIERLGDSAREAVRVKVIGAEGVEYEATDWQKWARLKKRLADESGSPAERFPSLPDHIDLTLTTLEECKRAAWTLLAAQAAERDVLSMSTRDSGILPGQLIDILDSKLVANNPGIPSVHGGSVGVYHSFSDATKGSTAGKSDRVGRYLVRRVTPNLIARDEWEFGLLVGHHRPTLAAALARIQPPPQSIGSAQVRRAIGPENLALPSTVAYRTSGNLSTTNTTNFFAVVDAFVTTVMTSSGLLLVAQLRARHSAPPASMHASIALYLTDQVDGGFTIARHDNVDLRSSTEHTPIVLSTIVDLPLYGFAPRKHRCIVFVKNLTAGTLTVVGGSRADAILWAVEFGLGGRRIVSYEV